MSDIFISYRRDDARTHTGRLADLLAHHLPDYRVFVDVDAIQPGEDFLGVIAEHLGACRVFVAVIGPRWVSIRRGLRRRLFEVGDHLELEVFAALSRGILVIPVLVGGAAMPTRHAVPASIGELCQRNVATISDDKFKSDVAVLAERIRRELEELAGRGARAEATFHEERRRVEALIRAHLEEGRRRQRKRRKLTLLSTLTLPVAIAAPWAAAHIPRASSPSRDDESARPQAEAPPISPQFGVSAPEGAHSRPILRDSHSGVAEENLLQAPTPFPESRGGPEPTLKLSDVLGTSGPQRLRSIEDARRIVFHAVGSTGNDRNPDDTAYVAKRMALDLYVGLSATRPSFLFHLGDVVVPFGEAQYYYDQFYVPFHYYPAPIVAVAGDHDGAISSGHEGSLRAFLRNFCATDSRILPEAASEHRTTQLQPGVYFTFEAPFVRILALYSNITPTAVISSEGARWSQLNDAQIKFLVAAFTRIHDERFSGAVILAVHHDAYTVEHQVGANMIAEIDEISKQTGVWPHAVLSGHAHNYQRYTRSVDGKQIPYVVAGAGGNGVRAIGEGEPLLTPIRVPVEGDNVILEHYDDDRYGYLRVFADSERLRIDYVPVSGPFEVDGASTRANVEQGKPADRVTIDLRSRRVVFGGGD
jgi:hypothetical protein